MPTSAEVFSMDEALGMLPSLCKKAFNQYPSLNNFLEPEELGNECLVQFIEKGYLQRFDSSITNKPYFLWVGVYRKAVDLLRKSNRALKTVPDQIITTEGTLSLYEVIPDTSLHDPIGEVILEESLQILDKQIVKSRPDVVIYEGQEMYFCTYWVFYLHYKGYDRDTIAKLFKVTTATVGTYVKKAQSVLKSL